MTEASNDWRAKLIAAIDGKLDAQTKVALNVFAQTARETIKRLVVATVSDHMLKAVARPTLNIAYAQFLYACNVPYEKPSPEFIEALMADLIVEIKARKERAAQ